MTCDRSSLEWFVGIEIFDPMTVNELNHLIARLVNINDSFKWGTKKEDNIQVCLDGDISLYLESIPDSDMVEVMRILTDYGQKLFVYEIGHQTLRDLFMKEFNAFSPAELLVEYRKALVETANPFTVWEAWKEESGFNDFVKEHYEDEEEGEE